MGLFGFKDKNKEKKKVDISVDNEINEVIKDAEKINIKILGEGCEKCDTALKHAKEAVSELGIDAEIEKIEDLVGIVSYGVMSTPGIVINDKVASVGRVLSVSESKELIEKNI